MAARIQIDKSLIEAFCRKWAIVEFSLFGSVLRDDFKPESDVDVMVKFAEDAHPTLFDLGAMREELMEIFHHEVDILTRRSVQQSRNPYWRTEVLSTVETIHVVAASA